MIAFNHDYNGGPDLDRRLQQEPIAKRYTPGNIAYYAASALTLGLPQTIKHGYKLLRDLDKPKSKENINLDILEIVGTGVLICLQAKIAYEIYSPLVQMLFR